MPPKRDLIAHQLSPNRVTQHLRTDGPPDVHSNNPPDWEANCRPIGKSHCFPDCSPHTIADPIAIGVADHLGPDLITISLTDHI